MKDPAFLFYSKEFYEGTRTMFPEERACYIDLLVYQHQHNGIIPDDNKRLLLYCTGISEATLEATLKAKFKRCDNGWYNDALEQVINDRKDYTKKQSINGTIGQFFKKIKSKHGEKFANEVRLRLKNSTKDEIYSFVTSLKSIDKRCVKATLKATLKGSHKHLANADANAIINEDIIEEEGGVGEEELSVHRPTLEEVSAYCIERGNGIDPRQWFDYYVARGWKYKGNLVMKDWKAAVRTWERNGFSKPPEPPKSRIRQTYDTLQQAKQMLRNEQPTDNSD